MTQEVIGEFSRITKVSQEIAKNNMFHKNSNKKTFFNFNNCRSVLTLMEDIYNEDISIYEADFI